MILEILQPFPISFPCQAHFQPRLNLQVTKTKRWHCLSFYKEIHNSEQRPDFPINCICTQLPCSLLISHKRLVVKKPGLFPALPGACGAVTMGKTFLPLSLSRDSMRYNNVVLYKRQSLRSNNKSTRHIITTNSYKTFCKGTFLTVTGSGFSI